MTAKLPRPVRLFAELCAARVRWQQQRAEMFDVNNAWYPAFNLPAFNSIGRDSAWKASNVVLHDAGTLPDPPTGEERAAWDAMRAKFPAIDAAAREAVRGA